MKSIPDVAPAPTTERPRLHVLKIDEPIDVRVGLVSSVSDLTACLEELDELEASNLLVVIRCRAGLAAGLREAWPSHKRALSASYLTLVWVPEGAARRNISADHLWEICHASRSNLYLTEHDPTRAVVGAMQMLSAGSAFAVLWPADLGLESAADLITQGSRWRASRDEPEEGVFHYLPSEAVGP
jgi:hypothetical protein